MLKQDSKTPGVYKFGMAVSDGWAAYYNNGHLFVATFDFKKGANYPISTTPCNFGPVLVSSLKHLGLWLNYSRVNPPNTLRTGSFLRMSRNRKLTPISIRISCR